MFPTHAQPFGAQSELSAGFLPGHIQHLTALPQTVGYLHQQRRFSDARFASQQDDRSQHQSATQYAVKLTQSCSGAHIGRQRQLPEGGCPTLSGQASQRCAPRGIGGDLWLRLDYLLRHGIPAPAVRAFAHPFGRFRTAFGADKNGARCLGRHVRFLSFFPGRRVIISFSRQFANSNMPI